MPFLDPSPKPGQIVESSNRFKRLHDKFPGNLEGCRMFLFIRSLLQAQLDQLWLNSVNCSMLDMSHPTSLEIRNAIHYLCNGGTQIFTTLDPQPRWYRVKRDRWLHGLRKQYQPTTTQQLSIVTKNSCVPQIQMDRENDRRIEPQSSSQSSSLV